LRFAQVKLRTPGIEDALSLVTDARGRMRYRLPEGEYQLSLLADTAVEDMEAGRREGIVGALLYLSRPARAETLAMIEAVAGEQAVQVTWYDDVDWQL
jgi:hypothetical protein